MKMIENQIVNSFSFLGNVLCKQYANERWDPIVLYADDDNEEWKMKNEEWRMKNEEWRMMNDEWWMKNEEWWIKNEEWWIKNEEWWI